ncbi:MAG: IS21-like element helper ATPase IstB [Bacillota bacterium]|nr:IS21-like element helper ATPase IstB [Bacillota bacterium]
MLNQPTIQKLKEMRLPVMARMLADTTETEKDMSFDDRLTLMVENEWLARKNNCINRLLKKASFPVDASIENIDYEHQKGLEKKPIQNLSGCGYIEQHLNLLITGMTGCGKTYVAVAFGNAACRKNYTVKYLRVPELLLELQAAKYENRFIKYIKQIQKVNLLILDDIGLKTYTLEESRDLLEIIEARYKKASLIMIGQIPHLKWYELFPDPTIADAIMDRIIHNSYIFNIEAEHSMREVTAKELMVAE